MLFLTLTLAQAAPAFASGLADDALQEQLRKEYVSPAKVHVLRNFYAEFPLKYDLAGDLIGKSQSGPWTLFGGVIIEQLLLKPDHLEIRGHRAAFVYDLQQAKLVPQRWDAIIIEIATREALDQSAQLHAALEKIFTAPGDDTSNSMPDYWQPYYSGALRKRTPEDDAEEPTASDHSKVRPPAGSGVVEGHLKRRIEPAYTPLAKAAHIQDTCVMRATIDKSGRLKDIVIVRPMGAGLDEEVIKALRQWEYEPYRLKGEPIEIETQIVIRFHL